MEVSLFITNRALAKLNPNASGGEGPMLATFGANRSRINAVATRVHAGDRRDFHILDESQL